MKNSFLGLIWLSFLKIQGVSGSFIAILLAVILWLFSPAKYISLKLAIPIGLFSIILIITLLNASYESFKKSEHILPKVLVGKTPLAKMSNAKLLCLLEPSELFSYDTLVSFYYISDENFEQLMGIGTVENIQVDKKIQVVMTYVFDGYEEQIKRLLQNDASILKMTKVKPNIPKVYLEQILQGGYNE